MLPPSLALALIPLLRGSEASPVPSTGNGHGETPMQQATITVDASTTYQQIDGFGFSSAFQRSSQIHGKYGLSPTNTSYVLDLLFSRTNGAGFSILRNGIGSSTSTRLDFMNSIEPNPPANNNPKSPPVYAWDGNDTDQLWLSQQAYSYGVRTFYANAWSAPAYMKSNLNDSNGGYICGTRDIPSLSVSGAVNQCNADWRQAFADYLAQYIKFYAASGIGISHVGFLNEPDLNQTYASQQSSGYQAADMMSILKPTLQSQGLGNVSTVCCEATGWRDSQTVLGEMQQAGNSGYESTDVFSSHGYSTDPKEPLPTDKKVWQTEWADLNGAWRTDWDILGKQGDGIMWANKVSDALTLSHVSGFLYWQGAENASSNSALISIGRKYQLGADTVEVSSRLWAMAHWSRFVRPGATRVAASENTGGLLSVSAFVNSAGTEPGDANGETVVVVVNNAHIDYQVELAFGNGSVQQYVTDNTRTVAELSVNIQGGSTWADIPRRSIVTFVS